MGGIYLRYDDAGRAWTAVGSRAKWADAVAYSEYGAWTAGVQRGYNRSFHNSHFHGESSK